MKRFELMGIIASIAITAALLQGCDKRNSNIQQAKGTAQIGFSFVRTKASVPIDTNSFILTVTGNDGKSYYSGSYGSRPSTMEVPAGIYDISVMSSRFDHPAFDSPLFGQELTLAVSCGEKASVHFLCTMQNSGVIVNATERFLKKYPGKNLVMKQGSDSLVYDYGSGKTAYFKAGAVSFNHGGTALFSKNLEAAQVKTLNLDATDDSASPFFSITVDTTCVRISEGINIGEQTGSGDGSSILSPMSVAEAVKHPDDTLWVAGYIVGGDLSTTAIRFEMPFSKSSNVAIADRADERERSLCLPVELSKAAVKNALNLVDHPDNLGRKVILRGTVTQYFGQPGLKQVTEYKL